MSEKNLMDKIAESNKSVTKGIKEDEIKHWVKIYVMGKEYSVPAGLTIMQAMEFAGYKFIRSCGCRAGFCGACTTVYRVKGDYKLRTNLACQTRVEDGMYLVQIPFSPAEKKIYDINEEKYETNAFLKHFPVIARCVSCNTCTKACPQELKVMDYIQAAIRGDFKEVAELSFDCIQCGLCALRCPAEIVHYHVGQYGRRMYGKYGLPIEKNNETRVKEIQEGKFEEGFKELLSLSHDELEEKYKEQQRTREIY